VGRRRFDITFCSYEEDEVIVAHARNVRLIGESRRKDDRLDAQTLARLARIGIPVSRATRLRGILPNTSRIAFEVVPTRPSSATLPVSSSMQ